MRPSHAAAEERVVVLRCCSPCPTSSLGLLPAHKARQPRVPAAGGQENGLGGKLLGSSQTRSPECFLLADPSVSSLPLLQPGCGLRLSPIPSDGQCSKSPHVWFGFGTGLGHITYSRCRLRTWWVWPNLVVNTG